MLWGTAPATDQLRLRMADQQVQWCSTPKRQSQHETQVQQCHLRCPLMALWWCLWKSLETQTSTVKSTPSETSWPDFWSANQNSVQIHFWALSPERSGWWWKCFQHQAQREASHPASHISQALSQDYAPGFLIPSATFFPSCQTAFPAKWRQLHLSTYTSMF